MYYLYLFIYFEAQTLKKYLCRSVKVSQSLWLVFLLSVGGNKNVGTDSNMGLAAKIHLAFLTPG